MSVLERLADLNKAVVTTDTEIKNLAQAQAEMSQCKAQVERAEMRLSRLLPQPRE